MAETITIQTDEETEHEPDGIDVAAELARDRGAALPPNAPGL